MAPSSSSTKQRVLYVADYFYPHWTGICKSSLYLVKLLNKDFDITILTVQFDSSLAKVEKIFRVTILREKYQFSLSRAKYSFALIFKFLKIVRQFDVVLINSPFSNIVPITLFAKLFRKKVLILHQADFILPKSFFNQILEKIYLISTRSAFSLCDKVSTWNRDYALSSQVLKPFLHKFEPIPLPMVLPAPS